MNAQLNLSMIGEWAGTMRLFLSWLPQPEFPSASRMSIRPVAQGKFLQLAYDWSYEGAQEGVLLIGYDAARNVATAAWVDTWHQSTRVMACKGSHDPAGAITLLGSFEVDDSPDWHWRICITTASHDELRLVMYNISPEGKEDLAVSAEYRRAST